MIKAIFEDTRQQMGKHENIAQYLKSRGIELIRQALYRQCCIFTKFNRKI